MENKGVLSQIFNFLLYPFIHILFTKGLDLYHTAFCYSYVAFLLLLPTNTPRTLELVIAFGTGLLIDIFYDSLGMNAAACVMLSYLRPYVIKLLSNKHSFENNHTISIHQTGFQWFIIYGGILLFIHHTVLFLIDTSDSQFIFSSLNKAFFSALFSLSTIVILQYLLGVNTQHKSR